MGLEQKFEFFAPIWRVMVRAAASRRCCLSPPGPRSHGKGGVCPAPLASAPGIDGTRQPLLLTRPPPLPLPRPAPQRDSNMSAAEVRQQVEYVALVTKQASSVSDLRRFAYSAPAIKVGVGDARLPGVCRVGPAAGRRPASQGRPRRSGDLPAGSSPSSRPPASRPPPLHRVAQAPVVYFRAATAGACTYFDDRRDAGGWQLLGGLCTHADGGLAAYGGSGSSAGRGRARSSPRPHPRVRPSLSHPPPRRIASSPTCRSGAARRLLVRPVPRLRSDRHPGRPLLHPAPGGCG